MNPEEVKHIKRNKYLLMQNTILHSSLLSMLPDVLGDADIKTLNSLASDDDKTSHFYDIILTRTDAYYTVVNALLKDSQTGAADILLKLRKGHHPDAFKRSNSSTCTEILEQTLRLQRMGLLDEFEYGSNTNYQVRQKLPTEITGASTSSIASLGRVATNKWYLGEAGPSSVSSSTLNGSQFSSLPSLQETVVKPLIVQISFTHVLLGYFDDEDNLKMLQNSPIPLAVGWTTDNRWLFGDETEEFFETTEGVSKRFRKDIRVLEIGGQLQSISEDLDMKKRAEFLLGALLLNLKVKAEEAENVLFPIAQIILPDWFSGPQRQQVIDAGKVAGFEVFIVNQSSALVFGFFNLDIRKSAAVFHITDKSDNVVESVGYQRSDNDDGYIKIIKKLETPKETKNPLEEAQNIFKETLDALETFLGSRSGGKDFATFILITVDYSEWLMRFRIILNGYKGKHEIYVLESGSSRSVHTAFKGVAAMNLKPDKIDRVIPKICRYSDERYIDICGEAICSWSDTSLSKVIVDTVTLSGDNQSLTYFQEIGSKKRVIGYLKVPKQLTHDIVVTVELRRKFDGTVSFESINHQTVLNLVESVRFWTMKKLPRVPIRWQDMHLSEEEVDDLVKEVRKLTKF